MPKSKAPYFVQVRGCINCDVSKAYKKETGNDYGFYHEGIGCLLRDCGTYQLGLSTTNYPGRIVNLMNPFIDPEEIFRMTIKNRTPEFVAYALEFCREVHEQLGAFYRARHVSLTNIIEKLEKLQNKIAPLKL